jgi:hypothetical protein
LQIVEAAGIKCNISKSLVTVLPELQGNWRIST